MHVNYQPEGNTIKSQYLCYRISSENYLNSSGIIPYITCNLEPIQMKNKRLMHKYNLEIGSFVNRKIFSEKNVNNDY